MKNYYKMTIEEIMKLYNVSDIGLGSNEAAKRLALCGKNKLNKIKKNSKIKLFLSQFNDLMIIVLLIAALISFVVSISQKDSLADCFIILAIVILNAIMGYLEEKKAEDAVNSLQDLSITLCKVKRDNKIYMINEEELVVGDIIFLASGDKIPADARILESISFKVDESILTGESISTCKDSKNINNSVSLNERNNMIYGGTSAVFGKCSAIVVCTAMNTELGLIASSLAKQVENKTPLQLKLNEISKIISVVIAFIICVMFIIGFLKQMPFLELFLLSISLAVAAIPEGLPAVITVILSLGIKELAKKNAIVRKMSSVETLGCTSIICSDKTGTITQNKMTVKNIYYNNFVYDENGLLSDADIFMSSIGCCNDAQKSEDKYIGDPTEIALLEFLDKKNFSYLEFQRISEVPFDSERKLMTTINIVNTNKYVFTKGSLDSLLPLCNKIIINNKVCKLDSSYINEVRRNEKEFSKQSLRILAFAYKEVKNNNIENAEENLIFLGFVGMIDPPRDNVKESIAMCKEAGIRPIMITGDSLETSYAIAKEIGIANNLDEAVLGINIDNLSEEQLIKKVNDYNVYARVTPEHKMRIVSAWQKNDKVVAMTGDGVNDAPSLKSADIGIGMGITGTEVSKGVSDIILADDCFNTIIAAIKEGRRIFDNIRNVILYLLTGNIAEVAIVVVGILNNIIIFLPIHLLYINLITDSIPAIALAFEKENDDIMKRKVRDKNKSLFTKFMIFRMIISAFFKMSAILLIYFISINYFDQKIVVTMCFLTLIILEMIFAFTCKDLKKSVLNRHMFNNSTLNKSMLLLIVIQLLLFLSPISKFFAIEPLSLIHILICIASAIVVFIIDELSKKFISKYIND